MLWDQGLEGPETIDMPMVVFYSWQLDTPRKTNKDLIQGCLQNAINQISDEDQTELQQAERDENAQIVLDHDTVNVPGTPDIVATILKKIDSCSVFIADVTVTGKSIVGEKEKCFPNPNVSVEFGYALKSLGTERIVLVMDTKYGEPAVLPFDFGGKRHPIKFRSDSEDLARERKDLTGAFKIALRSYYNEYLRETAPTLEFDWKVVPRNGSFDVHFGIRNNGDRSVKDASARILMSDTLQNLNRLGHINPYSTVWYNISLDSSGGDSWRARSHPGRMIAPSETDFAFKIENIWAFNSSFQPMSFNYEISTEHQHVKGLCDISQAAFAERGHIPALGWNPSDS